MIFSSMGDYLIPLTVTMLVAYGFYCGVDVFAVFVRGAEKGMSTAAKILPSLIALALAVGMLRASGGLDILSFALSSPATLIALPEELIPLAILRPISGSSAMLVFENILAVFHPDSYIGRVASVLMGCTETTFYTMAVYYGAVGITHTRHSLAASLIANLVAFFMSAFAVRLLLPC